MKKLNVALIGFVLSWFININTINAQCYNLSTGADTMGFENEDTSVFNNFWTIYDSNSNDTTWERSTLYSRTDSYSIIIKQYNEDWLFSRCYEMDTGQKYQISFWYLGTFPFDTNQNLYLQIGDGAVPDSMSDTLLTIEDVTQYSQYKQARRCLPLIHLVITISDGMLME